MISSWFHLFLLSSLCFKVFSAPLGPSYEEEDPELTGGYFEGDIVLDSERNGLLNESRKWPDAIVPYKISDQFEPPFAAYILQAMRTIEQYSCVRYVPAVNQTAYISVIQSPKSCNSMLGYANKTRFVKLKAFKLDKGCFRRGSILHELLHSLGFTHQHSSQDRDNYVTILTENIREGAEKQFKKRPVDTSSSYGENYDYGSVLHYSSFAFSKNGEPTIEALNSSGEDLMGQREKMSDVDIKRLNKMYKCKT